MELLGHNIGGENPLFFIAGPCVIESRDHALHCASEIAAIAERTGALIIYKSSFDKANRTSGSSYRGPGIMRGLAILEEVRVTIGIPVLTDVHDAQQADEAKFVADVLQTPAFLARQTDFIRSVAATGKPINIKKGQFMAPGDMKHVIKKAQDEQFARFGTCESYPPIMACERGATFGYGNLVVDMRGLPIMAEHAPVVFDATHSVQLPGAAGGSSGGERRFVPTLARAAVATGSVAGVFMETHPDPDNAPCDGPNAWPLDRLEELIGELQMIDAVAKRRVFMT